MLSPVLASFEIADSHGMREAVVGSTLFPLLGLRSVADRERRPQGGSMVSL